jgi:hypothetical protein
VKHLGRTIGAWAFLVGVIVAIIIGAGFSQATSTTIGLLALLGLIVGLLNVSGEEVTQFLLAGTVLVIVSGMGGNTISSALGVGNIVSGILDAIMILFVPATIVVALKSVFSIAKD